MSRKFAKSSTTLNQTKSEPINILVVGARNVGKSGKLISMLFFYVFNSLMHIGLY